MQRKAIASWTALLGCYLINQRIKLGEHGIGSNGRARIVAAGRNGFTKFGSL
ncbi:hypothetical protein D3C85_1586000 [compost metagenome]